MFRIGYVMIETAAEDEKDLSQVVRIIIDSKLTPAQKGIEGKRWLCINSRTEKSSNPLIELKYVGRGEI